MLVNFFLYSLDLTTLNFSTETFEDKESTFLMDDTINQLWAFETTVIKKKVQRNKTNS